MQTLEYRTLDKSDWGEGQWQDEPDKKQWQDAETGLPCLAVRGPGGHWCGYVGVSDSHPWHGKDYSSCTLDTAKPRGKREGDREWASLRIRERIEARLVCDEDYCDHTPEHLIDIHGGVTFAGACTDMSEEIWHSYQNAVASHQETAAQFPHGDSARWLDEWLPVLGSFDSWRERMQGRSVCHLPSDGEPDNVWWFGFDCAHCDDLSPKYEAQTSFRMSQHGAVYRDLAYVEQQCADLARQLATFSEAA